MNPQQSNTSSHDLQLHSSSQHTKFRASNFLAVPSPTTRVNSPSRSVSTSRDTAEKPRKRLGTSNPQSSSPKSISFPVLPSQPVEQDSTNLSTSERNSTPPIQTSASSLQSVAGSPGPTMSRYSSSSADSIYSTPAPQQYSLVTLGMLSNPSTMSQNDKGQLIESLRTHRVNTLTELRRIEKVFAYLDQAEVCEPMTSAWAYYVNSNNLLSELRGLTKNYPFSSECLDEAKWRVIEDPSSTRSWNYCWLVLVKIQNEQLISKHAHLQAAKPAMWGNRNPTAAGAAQLANAFIAEWTWALGHMLRHWETPPSTTGY